MPGLAVGFGGHERAGNALRHGCVGSAGTQCRYGKRMGVLERENHVVRHGENIRGKRAAEPGKCVSGDSGPRTADQVHSN